MIDLGYFANRRPIFNMSSVNGLSYDGENQRLYVLNGDTGEIYNCDMEYVQGRLLCFLFCCSIGALESNLRRLGILLPKFPQFCMETACLC